MDKTIRRLSRPAKITLGYFAAAAAWIFSSDELAALLAQDHDTLASIQAWKGAAFILATGLALYALLRTHPPAPEAAEASRPKEHFRSGMLALAFVVLAASIIGLGFLGYRSQATAFRSHQYRQQSAIAELKAEQTERWVNWHREDAIQLNSDPDLMEAARSLAEGKAGRSAGNIRRHFGGLLRSGHWAGRVVEANDAAPALPLIS